jgi:hypothetical protein
LKPLFVTGSTLVVVLFDIAIIIEFWARNRGRLVPYTSDRQRQLAGAAVAFALVGAVGLILLTVFDTVEYRKIHAYFLVAFV